MDRNFLEDVYKKIIKEKVNLDKHLPLMAYRYSATDNDSPKTVYGEVSEGLSYNYSDRLITGDWDKSELSFEAAKASKYPIDSCGYYEVFLSTYFDKPIEIGHIQTGCNLSNGFSYFIFGYKDKI